jgi:hypothetical protein
MSRTPHALSSFAFMMLLFVAPATLSAQDRAPGPIARLAHRIKELGRGGEVVASPAEMVAASSQGVAAPAPATGGDPYGFSGLLNNIRAAAGLNPLAYDPELSSWAQQNNVVQTRRGLGHHIFNCSVQNCGWNFSDAAGAIRGWLNSPGHRRNLLAPGVTRYGIAYGPGPYWTFNAR